MAADQTQMMRTSTTISIAQVKFKHAVKNELPGNSINGTSAPVTDHEISQFCDALDAVLEHATPANIQTCKDWIIAHVQPSSTRAEKVAELLLNASKAYPIDQNADKVRAARKRMSILFMVSAVLCADNSFVASWKPDIEDLVECAAEATAENDTAHETKLKDLISFWAIRGCITLQQYQYLRQRFSAGLAVSRGGDPLTKRTYRLPDVFGDRRSPWHLQPASYMIRPLIERPEVPINTHSIRAEQPASREVSDDVRAMLDDFFDNIDLAYKPTADNPTGETTKYKLWLDPMGQLVKQDKASRAVTTVCNGYGWSPKFCAAMHKHGSPQTIVDERKAHRERLKSQPKQQPKQRQSRFSDTLAPTHSSSRQQGTTSGRSSSDESRPTSRESQGSFNGGRRSSQDQGRFDRSLGNRGQRNEHNRGLQQQNQRWNNHVEPQGGRATYGGHGTNGNGRGNEPQGHPHTLPAFNNTRGFQAPPPPPPHMQGQYAGQPIPPPPPPPPFVPGGQAAYPPPPPMNFDGSYSSPPNMAGPPGHGYFQGGNNVGYGNQMGGNNAGYGNQMGNNHSFNNNNNWGGHGGQSQPQHHRGYGGGQYQNQSQRAHNGGYQGRGGNRGGYRGGNRSGNSGQWGGRDRY